jgi:hypothetical protein
VPKLALIRAPSTDEGEGEGELVSGFQDRETLVNWASKQVEKNKMQEYRKEWNANSLDGLPGLRSARRARGEILWLTDLQTWLRRIMGQKEAVAVGFVLALFFLGIPHVVQCLI